MLFITLSGLQEIAGGIQDYITMDYGYSMIADYTANFKNTVNPKTGRRRQECAFPITAETAEEITAKLREYMETDIYGDGQDYTTYVAMLSEQDLTEEMRQAIATEDDEGRSEIILEVERIILDDKHYGELCAQLGIATGGRSC